MGELTTDEYALIKAYFPRHGFNGGHDLSDIRIHLARSQSSVPVDRVLQALIAKRVLDASPDGRSVKFTDYGFELVGAMTNAQDEWDKQKIIRISNLERGQIPIRAGETFKANRVLREIFAQVRDQVAIVDLYVGTMVFDLLEDSGLCGKRCRLLTATVPSAVLHAYRAFRSQYGAATEMAVGKSGELHDRYILWDGAQGFHVGHSLKDLGRKDAQLDLLEAPAQQWALFEERWAAATLVE